MKVKIYIHACIANDLGRSILAEQILRIRKNPGLYTIADGINVTLLGHNIRINDPKVTVRYHSVNIREWEHPTINLILSDAQAFPDDNYHILYIHTKGVRHNSEQAKDWRNMMEYFLIDNWVSCVCKLNEGYDAVGCNYETNGFRRFLGNFWWTTAEFVRSSHVAIPTDAHRNEAEKWLLSNSNREEEKKSRGEVKVYSMHNSNRNHYIDKYPPECYESS